MEKRIRRELDFYQMDSLVESIEAADNERLKISLKDCNEFHEYHKKAKRLKKAYIFSDLGDVIRNELASR